MPAWVAPAIAAAGSVLGGLLGDDEQTTTTKQEYDFEQLRNSAVKAGYNPLTALRHGQPSGSTSTTTLSSPNFIVDALNSATDTYFREQALQNDTELVELQKRVAQAEIEDIKLRRDLPNAGGGWGVRQAVEGAEIALGSGDLEDGKGTVTNPYDRNLVEVVDPRAPDAEITETRYGDFGQEVAGVGNLMRDTVYSSKMKAVQENYGREAMLKLHHEYAKPENRHKSWEQVRDEVLKGVPHTGHEPWLKIDLDSWFGWGD